MGNECMRYGIAGRGVALQFSSAGESKRSIAISSVHISSHHEPVSDNDGPLSTKTDQTNRPKPAKLTKIEQTQNRAKPAKLINPDQTENQSKPAKLINPDQTENQSKPAKLINPDQTENQSKPAKKTKPAKVAKPDQTGNQSKRTKLTKTDSKFAKQTKPAQKQANELSTPQTSEKEKKEKETQRENSECSDVDDVEISVDVMDVVHEREGRGSDTVQPSKLPEYVAPEDQAPDGLSDITNSRGGRGRGRGRGREAGGIREKGSNEVTGRPRVNRATGQRMFVLSHAPLNGVGGASRGRGRPKVSVWV